jgi:hypothetical protein
VFTSKVKNICIRFDKYAFRSVLKKVEGSSNPKVELIEIGPQIDLKIERKKLASEDLFKAALKKPKLSEVIIVLTFELF